MARKKKGELPSGNIRIKVYDYTDAEGKQHYKSFTGPTRAIAELKAYDWKMNRQEQNRCSMAFQEAVATYINVKEPVLSVTTIKAYRSMLRTHIWDTSIGKTSADQITSKMLQVFISDKAKAKSPKSIRNLYGLISATLEYHFPNKAFKVTLPQKVKVKQHCPSSEELQLVMDYVKEKGDMELYRAILLASQGPLRIGEVCAITSSDIHGNIVSINKSMAQNDKNEWTIKQPKTYGSYRDLPYPAETIELLKGIEGPLFTSTPNAIYFRFRYAVQNCDIPYFTFHALRHYGCSILLRRGYSKKFVQYRGGWESPTMIDRIYEDYIQVEDDKENAKLIEFFGKELSI